MKRARLIYNRTAGKEGIERKLPRILERLEEKGLEASCHATRFPGDAAEAASKAVERGFDVVIAAGGDGTIHEVVNGIAPYSTRPQLGIIPCGTSNDLARALHLPRDMVAACDVIGEGHIRSMDVGIVQDHYFINVAAAGFLTEVTHQTPSRLKTVLGHFAYYAKGLEKLGTLLRPFQVRLESPQKTVEEEIFLIIVANSPSIGGFDHLVTQADIGDGLLDVLVVRKANLPELVHLVGSILRGEHLDDERVLYFQTNRLQVISSQPMKLNLDGEWGGDFFGRFETLAGHLSVLCPAEERVFSEQERKRMHHRRGERR
ncbi:YegS/Rv2252/BmrU family lipid kinase [Desmospora activa]|uniref:Diacylglycerol kinase n=1 Tax=Desmospora activa DSM 45169 TaxID=1121389 RepID=A0A2T4Z3M0_9BACL|nr:YegS/Rv2252/BmrU family lipid kinase [Desmospora activa]PTM56487.1 diacylglycerol kinase [Desmospora activa DSM 45169]